MELALFLPILLTFSLACIQFAIIFTAYVNVINATRDAARWVSVHPHVLDSSSDATVRARLPNGISSAALTLAFNPPCTSLSDGKCTARTPGAQLSVASTYNIASHLFLPSSLGWGPLTVAIPTTLPTYTIFMQVEPS